MCDVKNFLFYLVFYIFDYAIIRLKVVNSMFSKVFKTLRKEKNVTQKEIATYLNVSDRLVGYYENGQRMPPPDILEKIADYFNVTVDYLLGRTNIKNSSMIPSKNEMADEIESLSPESQEDLKKYIELLKIKDMQKKNTEVSDELTNTD